MSLSELGHLVGWIGDDFTGSAATLEILAFAGIPSILFLDVPTQNQLAEFADAKAIGIATTARSQSPQWMRKTLPGYFEYFKSLAPPIIHYKVCSTLDSSPTVGSIGCAIEIAKDILSTPWVPVLIAAPKLRRYQSFGHLFAAADEAVYRIDRHPTMARHPITPMNESDVSRHLMLQCNFPIGNLTLEELENDPLGCVQQLTKSGKNVITLDATSDGHIARIGELIWNPGQGSLLSVGSQGIEYALVQHWREKGWIGKDDIVSGAGPVEQLICVSGSLSPLTGEQIKRAMKNGFHGIKADVSSLLKNTSEVSDQIVGDALTALQSGQSLIIYTAKGPGDMDPGLSKDQSLEVSRILGQILKRLLKKTDIRRAVISGGDSSGHASQQLDLYALQALSPTIPGASLLRAFSNDPDLGGLELAFKGGQMGSIDYFEWIKRGGGADEKG